MQSVLVDLEREYTRDEDWCRGSSDHSAVSEPEMMQQINKHQEQKESFLKACTMARRNAESFLKYLKKCNAYPNAQQGGMAERTRGPESYVKSKSFINSVVDTIEAKCSSTEMLYLVSIISHCLI